MKIEVIPKTTTVRLIVTNLTPEKKYLRTPLGLCQQYRITLTDEKGQPLEMTAKGIEELTVPANGSVRVAELKTGEPQVALVRLAPLFNLPQRGIIRCEISRLVHFGDLLTPTPNPVKEWIKFPPVDIVVDTVAQPSPEK